MSSATTEPITITEHEAEQVERANASGKPPVAFVHGLWLLPNSWDRWVELFEEAGYVAVTPGWPDDPDTVAEAKEHPEVFAHKSVGQIADYEQAVIAGLERKPAILGHSFGGLLTQILAGRGLASVSVAMDPAPFRGVLPLPISALKSASPVLGNPANRNKAIPLTFEQFRYAFANEVGEDEAKELYETYSVPGLRRPALPGRVREPEPVDRGEGRHEEPGPRAAADPRRREGPHGSADAREGRVQEAGEERRRDRVRGDPRPRALAHDRLRLARRRREGARVRAPLRLTPRMPVTRQQRKRLAEFAAPFRVRPGSTRHAREALRPRVQGGRRLEEGRRRAARAGRRAAGRVPGAARGAGHLRPARRPAGDGRRRQGRGDPPRDERREPAGRLGPRLQGAVGRGARPRLPLAVREGAAAPRRDRDLQPLALRGGRRRPRARGAARAAEAPARRRAGRASGSAATRRSTAGSGTSSTTASGS